LYLDEPSSEVFVVASVLRGYFQLGLSNSSVIELSVLSLQLYNAVIGLG
jgi:hypothetical protein